MQRARVQFLVRELDPTCMPQLRSPPAATKTQHNQRKKEREREKENIGIDVEK